MRFTAFYDEVVPVVRIKMKNLKKASIFFMHCLPENTNGGGKRESKRALLTFRKDKGNISSYEILLLYFITFQEVILRDFFLEEILNDSFLGEDEEGKREREKMISFLSFDARLQALK